MPPPRRRCSGSSSTSPSSSSIPEFRRLNDHEKIQARSEFAKLFQTPRPGLICLTYSTVGLKADSDFLLWRIGYSAR